jgi:hypothetical protein
MSKKIDEEVVLPDFGFTNELTNSTNGPVIKPVAKLSSESDILSPEEVAAVRAEVEKQAVEDRKKKERKRLMEKFLAEARAADEPAQEQVEIEIILPPFACTKAGYGDIMIDGRPYMNKHVYTVSRSKAEGLREVMQRAWVHEEVTFGHRNPNAYTRPRGEKINEHGLVGAGFVRF